MARIQRVTLDGQDPTWTVLGDDFLPVVPVEEFLEYLRQVGSSPNTVRSYARGLMLWCDFLGLRDRAWDDVRLEDLTGFLGWIRTGLPPEIATISKPPPDLISDATAALRLQSVRSFYLFHQRRGLAIMPHLTVASDFGSQYKSFLHHIHRPGGNQRATVKVRRRQRTAPR